MCLSINAAEQDYASFRNILDIALRNIAPKYVNMPVDGSAVAIYRERVFCYELYHQMRKIWGLSYTLAGEVNKRAHPILLRMDVTPDFLVHTPGNMAGNFIVMEVKPCTAETDGIEKDLKNLTRFIQEASYTHGLLLVYGSDNSRFDRLTNTIKSLIDKNNISLNDLHIIFCKYPASISEEKWAAKPSIVEWDNVNIG